MFRNVSSDYLAVLTLCLALFLAASATAQPATRLVDISAGPSGSYPSGFQELFGSAYFFAFPRGAMNVPADVWRTDGTQAGTTRVFQTTEGALSLLVATSRKLFWLEGTVLPGPAGPCGLCPAASKLFASDGMQAGTAPVSLPPDLVPISFGGSLVASAEQVFFFGSQSGVTLLWRTDGSALGTRPLTAGGFDLYGLGPLLAFNSGVAFLERSLAGISELWFSDGTASGTGPLKTLSSSGPVSCWTTPRRLGRIFVFLADDASKGCNVWRSDGTAAGTVPIGVVDGGTFLGSAGGVLFFANAKDLWRTDGTVAGTFLLKSFSVAALAAGVGTREGVYFTIQTSGIVGATQQLWITDGSVPGTVLLHDFKTGGEDATIASLTVANGRLLASIAQDTSPFSTSLWTSDGTASGTVPVQQDIGASGPGFPYRGVTLFAGKDPSAGTELWAMNGSSFAAPVRPASLSLLNPCRVIDTRASTSFLGGPALVANAPRLFPVGDVCGIPATARAIAANVTVSDATSNGLLRIHASDIGAPDATVINFRAGQTRANNATIALGPDAEFTVRFETVAPAGGVHVIVDVVGFFE